MNLFVMTFVTILVLLGSGIAALMVRKKLLKDKELIEELEKRLSETNQQFLDFFDKVDVAIWSFNKESNLLTVSVALEKMYGYSREDFFRNPNLWEQVIHEEDKSLAREHQVKINAGQLSNFEHRIVTRTGEIRWVHCFITPIVDKEGALIRINGAVIDITEKKAAEGELEKQNLFFQNMLNTIDVALWSYDEDTQKVLYTSDALIKISGYPSETFIDRCSWRNIIHPDDISIFEALSIKVRKGNPDFSEYRIIRSDGEIRWIKNRIVPTMDEFGSLIRLDGVIIDITEQREIKEALAESEAKYRFIAENITDLVKVIDKNGTIRFASSSHKKVLGYERLIGTSAFNYVYSEDLHHAQNVFMEMAFTKTNKQMRFRLQHADGHIIYVDCLGTPILGDDGEVESIIMVSRDITEKVNIERRIVESEDRYQRLIELAPQPIISHREGRFVYLNPAAVDLLGAANADAVIGKSIFDIVHPDYLEVAKDRAELLLDKKYMESLEYKIIRFDGKMIEVETTGIYDDKTRTALIIFNDITERKKMERALQKSEERYRRLVELSPIGIAVYKDGEFVYVNPAGINITGAKNPDEFIGTSLPFDWVDPEDLEIVNERMKNTYLNGYSPPGEFRIIRMDGKKIDVSVTSIFDPQSLSVHVMFQDITARKQAERALVESEELNRRLIELSPEPIVFHSDYKMIYINSASTALFGASDPNELIDQTILDYVPDDYRERVYSRLTGIYASHSVSPLVEQKIIRTDGTVIDVEVIAATIPYKGKLAGVTMFRDIRERKQAEDDRKRAEQSIRESEERYIRLQTSLDFFSHDLFGVMKASEMERRLIKEVRNVIKTTNVSIIEVDQHNHIVVKSGEPHIPEHISNQILEHKNIPFCEIIDMKDSYFLKIAEIRNTSYLLCINSQSPSLQNAPKRVWLKTITRYVSVLYDNFLLIEDLTKELEQIASLKVAPPWLLRLLFNLSEHERIRLSQDLHDAALQEQIIWYRKLDQLSTDQSLSGDLQLVLQQIAQGLLDVIYQIRITCNELRPPMLKEEGLIPSLEALFEFTHMRSNYFIQFDALNFHHTLNDDTLIGFYRIVQELLSNATKHSKATQVFITLSSLPDQIQLVYEDDGVGMNLKAVEDSFNSMGIYGMKERVRSMDGEIEFRSSLNKGLVIFISIPVK